MKTLKANIETVARCLDKRGQENALLMHAADEASKNISDLALIWPRDEDYRDKCAVAKRLALIFNEELSRSPWRWAQVRWSFDALLKDMKGFREFGRAMANAEPAPVQVVLQNGQIKYEDAPPSIEEQLIAQRDARRKADQAAIAKLKKFNDVKEENNNKLPTSLDDAK